MINVNNSLIHLSSDCRLYLPIDAERERLISCLLITVQRYDFFLDSTKFRVVIRPDFQQLSNCKLVNKANSL